LYTTKQNGRQKTVKIFRFSKRAYFGNRKNNKTALYFAFSFNKHCFIDGDEVVNV